MKIEQEVNHLIESRAEEMAADAMAMCRIPAINPRMKGKGEYKRFQWLMKKLREYGVDYELISIPDEAVEEGVRENVIVRFEGTGDKEKTLWFIAHMDTVNTGDLQLWDTNPLEPVRKGDRIYGLGVEDNGQAVVEMLQTLRIIQEKNIRTKCNLAFLFASDEETGSQYGLHALLKRGVIGDRDEAVVPDGGSPAGAFVEIAEKSQVWLKFTVLGKQAHASMPHLGVNACSAGMHFGAALEDLLKEKYGREDPLFNPPISTFELTQKFQNVDSPNVMPGKDEFVMDCRILPCYTVDEVMETIRGTADAFEKTHEGIRITSEFLTRVDAPPATPPDALVVQNLVGAIRREKIDAYFGGIGGGTCGAILRAKNLPAVVWSTLDDLAHQPNEYVILPNMVQDTKIFMGMIARYC
jgi:succinyl-diaminopimelate desuccinylase